MRRAPQSGLSYGFPAMLEHRVEVRASDFGKKRCGNRMMEQVLCSRSAQPAPGHGRAGRAAARALKPDRSDHRHDVTQV
jgi:hypothetical protein